MKNSNQFVVTPLAISLLLLAPVLGTQHGYQAGFWGSVAIALTVDEQAWSPEELAEIHASQELARTREEVDAKIEGLLEKYDEGAISPEAFESSLNHVVGALLSKTGEFLEAGIQADQKALKEIAKRFKNSKKAKKKVAEAQKRIIDRKKRVKKMLIQYSLENIMDAEIRNAYGSQAVPFDKRQITDNRRAQLKALADVQRAMEKKIRQLEDARTNQDEFRIVLEEGILVKQDLAETLACLGEAFVAMTTSGTHLENNLYRDTQTVSAVTGVFEVLSGVADRYTENQKSYSGSKPVTSGSSSDLRRQFDADLEL